MPSTSTRSQKSAIPTFYYVVFGIIEPLITFASLLKGTFCSGKVICRHGPWQSGLPEAGVLPSTVHHTTIYQMVVVRVVAGFLNVSLLRAIRRLHSPALQEKIAGSLIISLAIGDVLHLFATFHGMGDVRWKMEEWPQAFYPSAPVGIALFIPRVCWLLGIGRYVATRDSRLDGEN